MADGSVKQDEVNAKPVREHVLTKEEENALDTRELLQGLHGLVTTKAVESVAEAWAKNLAAKEEGAALAAKLDHERRLVAQKWSGIHGTIALVAFVVLIVGMVALVQMKVLDETTIQKIALVVLALFTAAAGRTRQS